MKPIYEPKGKAKEYGDYAINIYTGCPHRCYYCFAPNVLHREREKFHSCIEPRKNIVEEVRKQIDREGIAGKVIHLCFTCDPYPNGYDSKPTREIIKILKESGNNVQILTKNSRAAERDFDLLDENDWFGVTLTQASNDAEPNAGEPLDRLLSIYAAKRRGIKTWVSFEPVINANEVLCCLGDHYKAFDRVKIGKLNYHSSDIDWKDFGEKAEEICKIRGIDYYIKDSLRAEMEKG